MLKGYTALEAVALEEPILEWHVYNFSWFCQQSETDRFEEISIGAYKSLLIVFQKSPLFSSWLPLFLFSSVNCFGQMIQTIIPMVSNLTSIVLSQSISVFTNKKIEPNSQFTHYIRFFGWRKKIKGSLDIGSLKSVAPSILYNLIIHKKIRKTNRATKGFYYISVSKILFTFIFEKICPTSTISEFIIIFNLNWYILRSFVHIPLSKADMKCLESVNRSFIKHWQGRNERLHLIK